MVSNTHISDTNLKKVLSLEESYLWNKQNEDFLKPCHIFIFLKQNKKKLCTSPHLSSIGFGENSFHWSESV